MKKRTQSLKFFLKQTVTLNKSPSIWISKVPFCTSVKLLAIAKRHNKDIEVRVHPTMIPESNTLAQVNGVFNAVYNPITTDKIITLSTCDDTGTKRVAVHAKLIKIESK